MNIYSSITTDFTNNGYGFLTCIEAKITEVINGEYSLSFSVPNNSLLSEYIIEENIVKCNGQLFRIKDISKGTSIIKVYATHIFYDLLDNIVEDIIPTNLTCESMIDYVLEHTNYETSFVGSSTIEGSTTARFVRRNPVEILIGDLDNSIARLYNAEIERDNYTIKMESRRGEDNNVKLILGKNIKEIDIKVNTQNQITRVMPIGFDGILLPEKYIDSPQMTTPKIRKIELNVKYDPEDELAYPTLEDAYIEMRRQVQELYSTYKIDEPEISITINWVELSKTEEYKNYSVLEEVNLGDTITISMHGIQYTTRVIKTVYNVLNDTIEQFEIGTFRSSLSYNTTKTIEELQKKVDLINQTSILETAQNTATALLNTAMGGYVYKTNNELFIMDTDNPNTAVKVWRWNVNGLGYSSNGAYGTYSLAMTADGAIVADFITTGTMSAERIEGLSEIVTDQLNIIIKGKGGTNLIKNSVGLFSTDWTNTHNTTDATEIRNNSVSKNAWVLQNKSSVQNIQVQNGVYNISWKYKKLITLAECKLVINDVEYLLDEEEWTQDDATIIVNSNNIEIEIFSDTDDACYLTDLMGNIGEISSVWSSAPGESINGGVKIGQSIEITSSNSNIKQVMDNDGNRIINIDTDETVAEYTDEGMDTKNITADSGTIGNLLFMDIGTQTLITRI